MPSKILNDIDASDMNFARVRMKKQLGGCSSASVCLTPSYLNLALRSYVDFSDDIVFIGVS